MKPLNYISIQGSSAPAFWFKNHDAQNFRSLVESVTSSQTLFISSIYRSDLFYQADDDQTDLMIRIWCTCKGYPHNHNVRNRFIRASDLHHAFEFYFESLLQLKTHTKHFERYQQRLNELHVQESKNEILKSLMMCDLHLAETYKNQHLTYSKLLNNNVPSGAIVKTEGFTHLANRYKEDAHNN